jgi:hypothetical protein
MYILKYADLERAIVGEAKGLMKLWVPWQDVRECPTGKGNNNDGIRKHLDEAILLSLGSSPCW